jgi:hypothetical protein
MLEYACTLWDGCSQQDSDYIEKLQLETVRIVTGLPLFEAFLNYQSLVDYNHPTRLSL